jgi:hypothetical protein
MAQIHQVKKQSQLRCNNLSESKVSAVQEFLRRGFHKKQYFYNDGLSLLSSSSRQRGWSNSCSS